MARCIRHSDRRHAEPHSEHPRETAGVPETHGEGGFGRSMPAGAQQVGGSIEAHTEQMLVRRLADLLAKEAAEVEPAHRRGAREVVDPEGLVVRRAHPLERSQHARVSRSRVHLARGGRAENGERHGFGDRLGREQVPVAGVVQLAAEGSRQGHDDVGTLGATGLEPLAPPPSRIPDL
jgi:hypothetical protein